MSYELLSNADSTTLTASYTAGAGSITVANSAGATGGFPASGNWRIRIKDASTGATKCRLKITAVPNGTHLTTTADGLDANCSSGDIVENVLSKDGLLQLLADGNQEGTYANLPASGPFTGAGYRQTDGPYDFRWNGSVWVPRVPGYGQVTVPPSSGWTWDNQGSSTINTTYGPLHLNMLRTGATNARGYYRSYTAPLTITVLMQMDIADAGTASVTGNDMAAGIGFRDSTGKWVVFYPLEATTGSWQIRTDKWTSTTSFSTTYTNDSGPAFGQWMFSGRRPFWLRMQDNNTNLIFFWSLNGRDWQQFDSRARTDFMASGPNAYGIFGYVNGNGITTDVLSVVES